MNRTHRLLAIAVALVLLAVVVQRRQARREMRDVPPPDTAVAGVYAARLPAADGPGRAITLRLTGSLTARLETDSVNGHAPIVDTGAWTKDDAGVVVVTLVPRRVTSDALDTLRFAVRGESLSQVGDPRGSAGLTLVRMR